MLRCYLTKNIRLHVWDSRLRVPEVSIAHDHPWDFRSYVVSGSIHNIVMKEDNDQPNYVSLAAPIDEFNWSPDGENYLMFGRTYQYTRTTIRCGTGGCELGDYVPVLLSVTACQHVPAGYFYERRAEEVHVSQPSEGCVTLVERQFRKDEEHAKVYFRTPRWVSAEPRPATDEEIDRTIASALAAWEG